MKKTYIIIALIAAMHSTCLFADMTVVLQNMGYYQKATVSGSDAVGIYQPGQTFDTFCLESNEYYIPGQEYIVGISTLASKNNYNPSKGYDAVLGGDPLDARTAFLYTNYMNGNTWGYTQQDFHDAIHYIEQERTTPNALVTIANNAITNGDWLANDLGNVRVMNVWYMDGTRAQDQLVMVVPAPAALALTTIGLGLVGWMRKRRLSVVS